MWWLIVAAHLLLGYLNERLRLHGASSRMSTALVKSASVPQMLHKVFLGVQGFWTVRNDHVELSIGQAVVTIDAACCDSMNRTSAYLSMLV